MATAASLEDVKYIDQRSKDVTFGYIQKSQTLFPSNNVYYTIPTLVIHWILLYYHSPEQFDPNNCSEHFQLTENNTVATQTGNNSKFLLLTNSHKTGVHQWKFELLYKNNYTAIIGVFKTRFEIDLSTNLREEKHHDKAYGYNVGAAFVIGDKTNSRRKYGGRCSTGDIVEMILDLDKLELKYIINDKDQGVAFTKIEATEYKACISGHNYKTAYKLLSYKQLR